MCLYGLLNPTHPQPIQATCIATSSGALCFVVISLSGKLINCQLVFRLGCWPVFVGGLSVTALNLAETAVCSCTYY